MSSVQTELAAQYRLARLERPDDDIDAIVALVAERMGVDGEASLAAESLAHGDHVDVIRQFVYAVEARPASPRAGGLDPDPSQSR